MIGPLNEQQIEALLKKSLVGRIACGSGDNHYIVPISYAYDNGCIYARTHEGQKITLMRQNQQVCFEVDDTRDTSNWQSVIAHGTFEELHNPLERARALQLLNNRVLPPVSSSTMHLSATWPFIDDKDDVDGVLFRICLHEKTGRFESSADIPVFPF